ncbi:MAG: histidine kinase [Gammaproteobacteria bacterium RIFCSPLOWO2_02_FULL_61_13]|nr:MAG: histidine kinase [Gammaproteobacteria bacterium RIFCSPLOWO2_02_FULL_61_13]
MTIINELLKSKGHDVWSIAPGDIVFNAIKMMADKGVGALMVMDGDKLVGVISERDYARKVILQGRSSKDTPVRDIMTTPVICARPEQTVEAGMALMTEKRIRHLPVVEEGRLVGIVSIGDLVKSILAEKEFLIAQLETYITS